MGNLRIPKESVETHPKVWGEEKWVYNGPEGFCGKQLLVKEGYHCSFHLHREKFEVFLVVSGKIKMMTCQEGGKEEEQSWIMNPGDVQIVPRRTWHQFSAMKDSMIIEFSTHHSEEDSCRMPGRMSGRLSPLEPWFSTNTLF